MNVQWSEAAPGLRSLDLESEEIRLRVLPERGCDVYALIHRGTGVDVLYKTPWGLRGTNGGPYASDSRTRWLEHYPGGWQLLLPNAGAACRGPGVEWGFHGEACLVPWTIGAIDEGGVTLSTSLARAPLLVERVIAVDAATVTVREAVTNVGRQPLELMWSHHVAFGPPFLAEGVRLATAATTLRADAETPGTDLAPGSLHLWPSAKDRHGHPIDYSVVPGPQLGRATLGYLEGFDEGWCLLTSPALGFGIRLTWPAQVMPVAWLWQELCASDDFPWFRQAYVMAVEPATTIGNGGLDAVRRDARAGFGLQAGERCEVVVRAELVDETVAVWS